MNFTAGQIPYSHCLYFSSGLNLQLVSPPWSFVISTQDFSNSDHPCDGSHNHDVAKFSDWKISSIHSLSFSWDSFVGSLCRHSKRHTRFGRFWVIVNPVNGEAHQINGPDHMGPHARDGEMECKSAGHRFRADMTARLQPLPLQV